MVMKIIRRDTLREIRKSAGRFLSIFFIVAIGTAFFAGIQGSVPVMKYTADKYFDDYNLMDIRIVSALGLTERDVEDIREVNGVEGVYPTHIIDVLTDMGTSKRVLRLHGIPLENLNSDNKDYINRVKLVDGRMPEKSGECLIEDVNFSRSGFKIGDRITLKSGTENPITNSLKISEYTIVGTAHIPYYISFEKGSSSIGHGSVDNFLLVPEEDFNMEVFSDIFVTVSGAKEENCYTDDYFEVIDPVTNTLKRSEWYVLDRNSHYGYVDYKGTAERMENIAKIFPVFFFIIAILVCLTTMTRMVDEQRGTIGTLKALGYTPGEIAMKYISYAGTASIGGGIAGCAIGIALFPSIIFNAWALVYTLPPVSLIFQPVLIICTILVASLTTIMAAFFACYKELTETPAMLMRPKSPKAGKKIFLERIPFIWGNMSFIKKVTARNLFRYKKRFFMTIIGVSGCTALLLSGYGIKDSVSDIARLHFQEIHTYDGIVSYASGITVEDKKEIENLLSEYSIIKEFLGAMLYSQDLENNDKDLNVSVIVPGEVGKFKDFLTLRERNGKKEVYLSDDGVLITEKLSRELGVSKGDNLVFTSASGESSEAKITGIIENYVGHYIIISPACYISLFEEAPQNNIAYLNLNDLNTEEENQLGRNLMEDSRVVSVSFNSGIQENFEKTINSLSIITVVMVIAAGALAFVVLYNLTNVNISERLREIATIKVLGFYDREVASYVYRENILLTVIGAFVGLGMGIFLHKFIMNTAEMDRIMFGRNINIISFIYSVLFTLGFSMLVNLVMYRKLKNIPMVESLKSIE